MPLLCSFWVIKVTLSLLICRRYTAKAKILFNLLRTLCPSYLLTFLPSYLLTFLPYTHTFIQKLAYLLPTAFIVSAGPHSVTQSRPPPFNHAPMHPCNFPPHCLLLTPYLPPLYGVNPVPRALSPSPVHFLQIQSSPPSHHYS